ncbi:MAG TPA: metallophosphoesterase [Candidatus Hydrogenedentes bacterium]|nr:metallophosphoesterase [Candidatus Hydrogenedentota bacterium]HOV74684.1 metallophosphoesterase [Candidatus Hydrogenedentota bacterium]HPC15530.1 metallophosphoesterase [Candidatus Hydrogenedentota bacterium]HRT19350.1 metallophosphoesterase [Candidatus Hydrogenedentota bacterium]HRT63916.1 metallophosphoesterase [Candidatus Hydrogenedentota bacterium]
MKKDAFAHIADIHFWRVILNPFLLANKRFWGNLTVVMRRRHEFVLERAEAYADAVAATGVRAVVFTGDFSSTSLDAEFRMAVQFVEKLHARGLDVHLMPGNHDVYTFRAYRTRRFEHFFAPFIPVQGYPALTMLPGGTPLLLVPTVAPRHFSARGRITRLEIDRVAELLDECGPRVVVAAHYPVLHATSGYHSNPFRRLENAERLREVLGRSNREILYICGHVHRFSFETDERYPNVRYLSLGAFLRTFQEKGTHGEFARVDVSENGFQITRLVHRGAWEEEPVCLDNQSERENGS